MGKTHIHHKVPRSLGGADTSDNLVELDFIEHAKHHAEEFLSGGIQFDFRHEGWPYLPKDLAEAVRQETGRRRSQGQRGEDNPMFGKERPDRREAWLGDNNPQRKEENREKTRQRVSGEGNPQFGKTGEANSFFGKHHTEETKQLLAKINRENPTLGMLGKRHSKEARDKMRGPRPTMSGKKHWVNEEGKTIRSRECPGPQWQQGRKWRPQ